MRRLFITTLLLALCVIKASLARAVTMEWPVQWGSARSAAGFVGSQKNLPTDSGLSTGIKALFPLTSPKSWFHVDATLGSRLGIFSFSGGEATGSSAWIAPNFGLNLEIWRIYVGGAFAPLTYRSKWGGSLLGLRTNPDAMLLTVDAGILWRMVPQLHVGIGATIDQSLGHGGGTLRVMSYGLVFRFPLNPKGEQQAKRTVEYDGWRYPFGLMK